MNRHKSGVMLTLDLRHTCMFNRCRATAPIIFSATVCGKAAAEVKSKSMQHVREEQGQKGHRDALGHRARIYDHVSNHSLRQTNLGQPKISHFSVQKSKAIRIRAHLQAIEATFEYISLFFDIKTHLASGINPTRATTYSTCHLNFSICLWQGQYKNI